jgi:hypothetical protein
MALEIVAIGDATDHLEQNRRRRQDPPTGDTREIDTIDLSAGDGVRRRRCRLGIAGYKTGER